jgi:hypothetical protein
MFDLESSIVAWREQMLAAGIQAPVPLEELEAHLRDEIAARVQLGTDSRQAFEAAIREVGQPIVLKMEFTKAGVPVAGRLKNLVFTLAGIPHQLATTMNTNLEPRWVTYLKTSAVMLPAMFLWVGACVFVLPQLKEIYNSTGHRLPNWFMTALSVTDAIKGNIIMGSLIVTALLVVLEWRSQRWAHYRRLVFGVTGFTLNLTVMVFIAATGVLFAIAANELLLKVPATH